MNNNNPKLILKSLIAVSLLSLSVNVCQARGFVSFGVGPAYGYGYPAYGYQSNWVPGHYNGYGYWIPGHYVQYYNSDYYDNSPDVFIGGFFGGGGWGGGRGWHHGGGGWGGGGYHNGFRGGFHGGGFGGGFHGGGFGGRHR